MTVYILPIIIGYLLGSVSPSYILGRALKNVDIRNVGEENAGTTNTYRVLGLYPAIITAIYDLTKGLLAMMIAYLLNAPEPIWYLAGLSAVVGHVFPFYLNFRGGQGVATSTGLLLYCLYVLFKYHAIPWESLGILIIIVIGIYGITRNKTFLALIVMPSLFFLVFKNYSINYLTIFTGVIIFHIFSVNIYEAAKHKLFKLKKETFKKVLPWRSLMRPLAVVFPIAYFYLDKNIMLWVIGVIGLGFLALDLVRLFDERVNIFFFKHATKVFKKREESRFSSMTLFFLSMFFTVLLFNKYVAITSIVFLIFGDLFAKFFGSEYGKIKLWNKTLEGSIAFFCVCLLAGYLLWPYVNLSPIVIALGAFVATLAEVLPIGINDNFIVSLSSAATMMILSNYIK
jgi:glycerol-3-phosphate acyltransferase PlsY